MTLLSLLDLTVVFHQVDHDILLCRLCTKFHVCGSTIDWIKSFLQSHTQQVHYTVHLSAKLVLLFGVPQRSVLGPSCSCCIPLSFSTLSPNVDSPLTHMPTTCKYCSLRPHPKICRLPDPVPWTLDYLNSKSINYDRLSRTTTTVPSFK